MCVYLSSCHARAMVSQKGRHPISNEATNRAKNTASRRFIRVMGSRTGESGPGNCRVFLSRKIGHNSCFCLAGKRSAANLICQLVDQPAIDDFRECESSSLL